MSEHTADPVTAKDAAEAINLLRGMGNEYARSLALQKCPAVAAAVSSQTERCARTAALFIHQHTLEAKPEESRAEQSAKAD
jgi:hypothetical protein